MAVWAFRYKTHSPASGQHFVTTFHYASQVSIGDDDPAPADVLGEINDHLYTTFADALPSTYVFDEIEVAEELAATDLGTLPRGAVNGGAIGNTGNLAAGDGDLPEALCAIISKRTNVPKRFARGYLALPGSINTTHLDDGLWVSPALTAYEALAALMDDDLEISGAFDTTSLVPCVYSRHQHDADAENFWFGIQSAIAREPARWRRSRIQGT
jgi:hypothetical protein